MRRHTFNPSFYIGAATTGSQLNSVLRLKRMYQAPNVAFCGRSNVGKSSLLNSLLGYELAIVSGTPGRTRLMHAYAMDGVGLVDLPGYGYAIGSKKNPECKRELEKVIVEAVFDREETDLVMVLIDARRQGLTDADADFVETLQDRNVPFEIIVTKCDAVPLDKLGLWFPKDDTKTTWLTSSKTGRGIREVKKRLMDLKGKIERFEGESS